MTDSTYHVRNVPQKTKLKIRLGALKRQITVAEMLTEMAKKL